MSLENSPVIVLFCFFVPFSFLLGFLFSRHLYIRNEPEVEVAIFSDAEDDRLHNFKKLLSHLWDIDLITMESRLTHDLHLDQLDILETFMKLEDVYGVEIDYEVDSTSGVPDDLTIKYLYDKIKDVPLNKSGVNSGN